MVSERWKKIVVIALIVFTAILVLIGVMLGMKGLKQFFQYVAIALLVLCLIGGVFYVVYLIFFAKEYKDIPAQFRKKLQEVSKVMQNDMLGNLYLSGDTKHNRINLGKYFWLRLNLPKMIVAKGQSSIDPDIKSEAIPIDCFIIKKKGFFNLLFSDPVFILVKPEDHDYSTIFNDVTIKGFNLIPLDSQFFTIDSRNLDLDMIKGLALNYIREVVYEVFKDLDRLVKQSMNLDHEFQKDKEKAREFEIPQLPPIQK